MADVDVNERPCEGADCNEDDGYPRSDFDGKALCRDCYIEALVDTHLRCDECGLFIVNDIGEKFFGIPRATHAATCSRANGIGEPSREDE